MDHVQGSVSPLDEDGDEGDLLIAHLTTAMERSTATYKNTTNKQNKTQQRTRFKEEQDAKKNKTQRRTRFKEEQDSKKNKSQRRTRPNKELDPKKKKCRGITKVALEPFQNPTKRNQNEKQWQNQQEKQKIRLENNHIASKVPRTNLTFFRPFAQDSGSFSCGHLPGQLDDDLRPNGRCHLFPGILDVDKVRVWGIDVELGGMVFRGVIVVAVVLGVVLWWKKFCDGRKLTGSKLIQIFEKKTTPSLTVSKDIGTIPISKTACRRFFR